MRENMMSGEGADSRPSPRRAEPDAHGQAALVLVESILHALVESNTLTLVQAVDVVRTAAEVKVEIAEEIGETEGRMQQSLSLLSGIERSLTAGDHDVAGAGR